MDLGADCANVGLPVFLGQGGESLPGLRYH